MRVVLDTNILFSALISPHGPPDAIYRAWRSARFELVTSRQRKNKGVRPSIVASIARAKRPAHHSPHGCEMNAEESGDLGVTVLARRVRRDHCSVPVGVVLCKPREGRRRRTALDARNVEIMLLVLGQRLHISYEYLVAKKDRSRNAFVKRSSVHACGHKALEADNCSAT